MSQIKEYVQKALALEKTVYTLESLTKEYTDILNNHRKDMEEYLSNPPVKPVWTTVTKEQVVKQNVDPNLYIAKKPVEPQKPSFEKPTQDFWSGIAGVLGGLLLIFCLFEVPEASIVCILGLIFFWGIAFRRLKDYYFYCQSKRERYKSSLTAYENALKNYPLLQARLRAKFELENEKQEEIYKQKLVEAEQNFKKAKEKAESEYASSLDSYNQQMAYYNQTNEHMKKLETIYTNVLQEHHKILEKTRAALAEHYSSNIIYPKYQYFIAVASICEYLSSGRCDSLEGPDGAYNIYESELRQNLIINQLASVLGDVNQIKTNQYLLYQELTDAGNTVKSLSSSISSAPIEQKDTVYNNYLESVNKLITS